MLALYNWEFHKPCTSHPLVRERQCLMPSALVLQSVTASLVPEKGKIHICKCMQHKHTIRVLLNGGNIVAAVKLVNNASTFISASSLVIAFSA